jgi:tetratricopeptide (TPR) repeat protein
MGSPVVAYTLYVLAMIAADLENTDLSQARFEECLQISRKMRNDWLTAWALEGLGSLLYRKEEYEKANRTFAEAHTMFIELGDNLGAAHALISMGREAQRTSDYKEAELLFRESLSTGRELDNIGLIAGSLAGLAGLAAQRGEVRRAASLFASAEKLFHETWTSLRREQMVMGMDVAEAAISAEEWQAAWAEGEAMSREEAIALALSP